MTLHLKMATPLVLTEKRPRSTFVCLSIIKKLNAIAFLKAMEKVVLIFLHQKSYGQNSLKTSNAFKSSISKMTLPDQPHLGNSAFYDLCLTVLLSPKKK